MNEKTKSEMDELVDIVKSRVHNTMVEFCKNYSWLGVKPEDVEIDRTPDCPFGFDVYIYFRGNARKNLNVMISAAYAIAETFKLKVNPIDFEWENLFENDAEFTRLFMQMDFVPFSYDD